MTKLFGIPMNTVMGVLVAVVVIALLAFVFAALRSPVLFKLGLRNIPRRRAQTLIIVFGLMVSTLIITAAFTVGDSLSYSITKVVYDRQGPVDLTVQTRSAGADASAAPPYISNSAELAIEQQVGNDPNLLTWLPFADEPVPAGNPDTKAIEPRVQLVGLDPDGVHKVGGLPLKSGGAAELTALQQGEAYINETAATKLDAKAGSSIVVYFNNQLHPLTVKQVLKDRVLTGWQNVQRDDNGGVVMSLAAMRQITGRSGVNGIRISTSADPRGGADRAARLFPAVKAAVDTPAVQGQLSGSGATLKAVNSKHDDLDSAQAAGNLFTTFFLIIGLFSIAAGMMLIFLIFVMLAAERRAEMGMARAVGIKRAGLVQTFLAEGMVYNLIAGMVGAALGVGVAFGLVWIATHAIFTGKNELPIGGHVSGRAIIVSYCLGVALTFITVVVSAYRTTRMNIVAAIRDLPEDSARSSEPRRLRRNMLGSSAARIAGAVLFSAGLGLTGKLGGAALIVALAGLALLAVAALPVTRSVWGIIWRTVVGIPAGVVWGILGVMRAFGMSWSAVWSVVCVLGGLYSLLLSHTAHSLFLFMAGVSLTLLGLALIARVRRLPARLAFTLLGALLLAFWLEPSSTLRSAFGGFYGHDEGGPEMFFLSGLMLVLSTTLLLIFNGELLAAAVNRLGGWMGSLRPSLATALAYPMASKTRTGMTIAMFSLIIFSITVMSSLNSNFSRMLLSKDATGGWDVAVATNLNNPIGDLKTAMQQNGIDTSKFTAIGGATPYQGLTDVRMAGANDWQHYFVRAADPAFLDTSTMKLQAHLKSLSADEVWKQLQRQPGTALIDAQAIGNNNTGSDSPNFNLKGVKSSAKLLDHSVDIEVRNAAGNVQPLKIIGVINQVVAATGFSIFTSGDTYQQALGAKPAYSNYAIRLTPGTDDRAVAKQIRANMGQLGVTATSVRSDLEDQQAAAKGFSYLFEAFMGLGLFVGIAAVAVIAARTVVERRQQIGMLRAVGYRRGQVALSFALETSFIALFGLAAGMITASILSYNLFTGGTFGDTSGAGFQLPLGQILLFAGLAYLASLAMTYFPSRRAASLPIAEALRYE